MQAAFLSLPIGYFVQIIQEYKWLSAVFSGWFLEKQGSLSPHQVKLQENSMKQSSK